MARANTVRDFLTKYAPVRPDRGRDARKVDPKYAGQKPGYTKTDEARWMNRRVVITVTDIRANGERGGVARRSAPSSRPSKPPAA